MYQLSFNKIYDCIVELREMIYQKNFDINSIVSRMTLEQSMYPSTCRKNKSNKKRAKNFSVTLSGGGGSSSGPVLVLPPQVRNPLNIIHPGVCPGPHENEVPQKHHPRRISLNNNGVDSVRD